ncbi:MAG: hypothetical protein HY000_41820 [Planctomycetes bacterium]|nr:hypothetical protein [Planctomycetota bacterium]
MLRRVVVMGGVAIVMIASLTLAQPPGRQGRGFGFGGQGGQGSGAMLLATPDVRKELGTSEEQNKKIDDLLADLQEQMRESFGNFQDIQNLSQEERQKRFDETRKKGEEIGKKADEKLSKILEPKQADRLKQLRLQREGAGAFNREEIAKELGLTKDQQDKIRKIQETARPQGGGGFQNLSDEERRELLTKMREQREKAQKDIFAVLTEVQTKKWSEMKGKEFKFPEGGFGGFGPGGRPNEERKRPEKKKID